MRPTIDDTSFGKIIIEGKPYDHDVIIRLNGTVEKRRKKLSKAKYGTSHRLSLEEAQYIYEPNAAKIIIGTGQHGVLELSEEATRFFEERGCHIDACPTRIAVVAWNHLKAPAIGLFHLTC